MPTWKNLDGLTIRTGLDSAEVALDGTSAEDTLRSFEQVLKWDAMPAQGDANGDRPSIPAGAYIKDAFIVVEEAFTSAGATTLTLGLGEVDGTTVIDADGIDAAVAKAALGTVGAVVKCDGALVGGTVTVGDEAGYLYATVATGPYTAGKARLVVNYNL